MNYNEFIIEIESKCAGKKKLQIENFTNYCNAIGNPEKTLKALHIGGTNGKGSTSAMIESILCAHGYSVGLNTSPHLVNYKERFRINKQEIKEEKLLETYLKYRDLHSRFDTSFFEISTALAFQIFYDESVDYAVIEVGMGGRLDATKLVHSEISVITNIGLDHTKSLGGSLEKIAWQKAGILKPDTPVIIGKMPDEAKNVILNEAKPLGSKIISVDNQVILTNPTLTPDGNFFDIELPEYGLKYQNLICNMVGIHQLDNVSTALLCCAEIAKKHHWQLDEALTRQGLSQVLWQGRMQKVAANPTIIIDGAHNPDGIEKLVYNLANIYQYEQLLCVVAILSDKDFKLMLRKLSHIVDTFIITKSKSPRASSTNHLFDEVSQDKQVIVREDVKEALQTAKNIATEKDLICVTGSLYTVKEILEAL
ncbi:MAG: bifunctional folylpolyglutamate synthase/dihydrofolate synthase [Candidatus Marinimicrobia bacterium]|nr:bifunctional folylpolyglutamate synthase/dihydrofolate synthase [Candidatus Neomarinimicrobiota bacterium]